MAKVYEFLADGFEEIEAMAPVDILRRGGVEIKTVSVTGSEWATSSHGVPMKADLVFTAPEDYADADMILLPGGLPGATNLNTHEGVRATVMAQIKAGRRVGAICAAPMVLGSLGLLKGKKATCSPGFEHYMTGADYTAELFQEDGLILTGEGPAAALPYAYHILGYFVPEAKVKELEAGMQYAHLMAR